ncbi:MAG TPA: HAMP domain-containing sensor histidine kinase [Steroidobacteraceae bacterium]|nr:HAMP domain-containing sensor histidine kinase [Steroidobacteraceae bacterium]
MDSIRAELVSLAQHMSGRRDAILLAWQGAIKRDPKLKTGEALPRVQLLDHIPAILSTFVRELQAAAGAAAPGSPKPAEEAAQQPAAAHGLQRWRQGYDLREVTRELGKLNECVIAELDAYTDSNPAISHAAVAAARRIWSALSGVGIEESVAQYFALRQTEAAGHVRDLESALAELKRLEEQRAELWRQAAHDLRGNLGVVANATVALTHGELHESARDEFVRILMRNVASLHHLLEDVTSLARLQAGREQRRIEPLDVSLTMQQLCEGIRPLAQQQHLFLRCEGPPGFFAEGDTVKVRRIAQNLILNAVKFTRQGGITVSWGDSDANDPKRWRLTIQDTGPGFHSSAAAPMSSALASRDTDERGDAPGSRVAAAGSERGGGEVRTGGGAAAAQGAGEGIGLSIVKRLCDMLDAAIEVQSEIGAGTTFHIRFPRSYQ